MKSTAAVAVFVVVALAAACAETVVMQVTPSVVERSGDQIVLSWSGVTDPNAKDWIGIWTTNAYIGRTMAYVGEEWKTGAGSIRMTVYNMRHSSYTYHYYRSTAHSHVFPPLVVSPPVTFRYGSLEPTQLHLSTTNKDGQMRVMWISGTPGNPSTVRYGLVSGQLNETAAGVSHTYHRTDLCEDTKTTWIDPGWIHDVLLENLEPNRRYYYVAGSDNVMSQEYEFLAPSPSGVDANAQFKFIMFGDMGNERAFCDTCLVHETEHYGPGAVPMMHRILSVEMNSSNPVEFLAHIGDISYARNDSIKWEFFGHTVFDVAARLPYLVSIGNHEYDYNVNKTDNDPSGVTSSYKPSWGNYGDDSGGECGVPIFQRYHMPDNGNSVFWYSYEHKNLHFTVLSFEHSLQVGSPQRAWLENDLRSVRRDRTPWLIVAAHRPIYCSQGISAENKVGAEIEKLVGSLLQQYSVDLFMAGHYHSYQRTCPVFNQTCHGSYENARATVHLTVGTGGIEFSTPAFVQTPWSMKTMTNVFAYSVVNILNSTDLHMQLIDSDTGAVLDQMMLHSEHKFIVS